MTTTRPVTEKTPPATQSEAVVQPTSRPATEPASQPTVATLIVGDPAPPLAPAKWIKGEPVEKFERGKVYVVEFWATWCGPCKKSIPHITELASTFKDVTFIGQDIGERDHLAVETFVKAMGDRMNYRVAVDDLGHATMSNSWMRASRHGGIPTAFVVDGDTRIAWIGHPMDLDAVLRGMQAGTFNPQESARIQRMRDNPMLALERTLESGDLDKILAKIDELSKNDPEVAEKLAVVKYQAMVAKKDMAGAMVVAKRMIASANDEPYTLDMIAIVMVAPDVPHSSDTLSLAEQAVTRANGLTEGNDARTLDTLAHVYAAQGYFEKALATEKLAVEKNTYPPFADEFAKALDGFKLQAGKQ